MTILDLGDFKLRFDPKEVRINIDGEMIDVGARRIDPPKLIIDKTLSPGLFWSRVKTNNITKKEKSDQK